MWYLPIVDLFELPDVISRLVYVHIEELWKIVDRISCQPPSEHGVNLLPSLETVIVCASDVINQDE